MFTVFDKRRPFQVLHEVPNVIHVSSVVMNSAKKFVVFRARGCIYCPLPAHSRIPSGVSIAPGD